MFKSNNTKLPCANTMLKSNSTKLPSASSMFKLNAGNTSRAAWGVLFLLGIALTACGKQTVVSNTAPPVAMQSSPKTLPHAVAVNPPGGAVLLSGNTQAGDALGEMLLPKVGSSSGVLVTTMVNMEDFDKSSAFGRTSMQQIGSRLSQHGFKVLEPRLGSTLRFEKRQGEFMLTRDTLKLLANTHDAHAVMVGTYSESKDKVFLSVRVVRFHDSAILAAYEYYLPKSADVEVLMGSARAPGGNHLWSRYVVREQAFIAPKK